MNIAEGLAHAKKIAGSHEAIVCGDTRCTWEEFEQRTDALARGLASLGVLRGDRVAVLMLNCHRYLELYYACARMGAVIVPLNIRLARPEIIFILNDSETKVLVVDKAFAVHIAGREAVPTLEAVIYNGEETPATMLNYEDIVSQGSHMMESVDQEMDDDELSGLYYTGGTTGRAKGVMLSHKNVVSNAINVIMAASYTQQDTYLHAAPMFHLADIGSTFAITMVGARHVFIPLFNPVHVLQAISNEKITATLLVPTMVNAVLNHPDADSYNISSLRRLTYGASPMPLELLRKGLRKWGQIFAQGYGMTETSPLLTGLDTWDHIIDGTPEQMLTTLPGGKAMQALTYNNAGSYTLRVTVYDASNTIIYVARRKIRVYLSVEFGLKVVNVYKSMVNRLIANNPASALRCFTGDVQPRYQRIFDALGSTLPGVALKLQTLIDGSVNEDTAELTILQDTTSDQEAIMIHMIRGGDGIWRIENM